MHGGNTLCYTTPLLLRALVPLLLYADDLILMSTTAAGLQKQLDALASFCKSRELTVNLNKTHYYSTPMTSSSCLPQQQAFKSN